MMHYKAPKDYSGIDYDVCVFLAGSSEMDTAEKWQDLVAKEIESPRTLVLNPRRDDWNCVDEDTKALTDSGLKYYHELSKDDNILTYNEATTMLEYKPIVNINIFDYSDKLAKFGRNDAEWLFTHNHQHFVTNSIGKISKLDTVDIINLKERRLRIPTGATLAGYTDVGSTELIPEGNKFLPTHFKLAAWVLSEGSIFKRKDCNSMNVVIAQYATNENKVHEIKSLLDELNINYRYDKRMFILDSEAVHFILNTLCIKKYELPIWVKLASPEEKNIFLQEYIKGDGHAATNGSTYIAFSEKYRQFAESVQILAFECGYTSYLKTKVSGYGHPVINLILHNVEEKSLSLKYSGDVHYDGKVWCPTTVNGSWVAYKNGIPFITGNSSWIARTSNKQFAEHVSWEHDGLHNSDIVFMYFDPKTKSPITLLELGLMADSGKLIVCCSDDFWRKGNVEYICEEYGIPLHTNLDDAIAELKERIKEYASTDDQYRM